MELFHGTTKIAADEIVFTKSFKESQFDIKEYFNYVLENTDITKFPHSYKIKDEEYRVKWLGKGVYAFGASDFKLAETWQTRYGGKVTPSDCGVVKLVIPVEVIYKCIDVTSLETRRDVLKFLSEELQDKIAEKFEKDKPTRRRFLLMVKYLEMSFREFAIEDNSYLIGVALELYLSSRFYEVNLVKGTFNKKNKNDDKWLETYYCVRNKEKIINYSII